jgi:outer membrane protein assembly factor BamB
VRPSIRLSPAAGVSPRRLAMAILLAAATGLAACQGSSSKAPDQVPTTVEGPVAATASPCATPPRMAAGQAGPADWTTYHRGNDRHGVDTNSPTAGRLKAQWGAWLDGPVFTQPLVYQGLVVVATQQDSVFAFDRDSGCLAWKTSLGQPVDATNQPCASSVTAFIGKNLGITGTPVVDPATATLFVVSYLDPARFEMDALDLGSGAIRWRRPLDLPAADLPNQLSRPALTLANGRVYAGFGGRAGSCGNWHGYLVGVAMDGQGPVQLYSPPGVRGGSIWEPGGPVVLPGGDLLVTTSEAESPSPEDGNSVVRLSPDLQTRVDSFTPSNWPALNKADLDLGSVGPTLLADGRVFQVGKEGVGYLLNGNHLGGLGGQLYSNKLGAGCYAIGATAYRDPYVFVPCDRGLKAVQVQGGRFQVAWTGPDFRAGSPMLAGGVLWDVDFEGGYLWGLDPKTGQVKEKASIGKAQHFVSPSSSAGHLYVPDGLRLVSFSFN